MVRAAFVRDGESRSLRDLLARNWHVLYIAVFLLTALTNIAQRLAPDFSEASAASNYSALVFILTPFVIAGLKIWRDRATPRCDHGRRPLRDVREAGRGVTGGRHR